MVEGTKLVKGGKKMVDFDKSWGKIVKGGKKY